MSEKSVRARGKVSQAVLHAIMIISLFMVLYPLMSMVFGAFKSGTTYQTNKWLPSLPLRLTNITDAFASIGGYLKNTIIVAVLGIGGLIFISSMASFSISKLKFKGRQVCFSMILALTMLPGVLSLTPQFLLYSQFGLQNNLFALILPMWTGGCVFGVFLLNGFYGGLPNELFEAAELDGAGAFKQFTSVALPLSMPIIATLVIMQISNVWSDYLWPQIILEEESYTIAAGLAFAFENSTSIAVPIKYGAYLLSSLPLVLLFIFFNRFYVEGLASSGIKL